MYELDEMRHQMNELKERLDRETTLREQLLRDSLDQKVDTLNSTVNRQILLGCVAILLWGAVGYFWHLSLLFIIFTAMMLMITTMAEYCINRIDDEVFYSNLAETARFLVKMKKRRLLQVGIGMSVILLIWLPWVTYEFRAVITDKDVFESMMWSGLAGVVIGSCIGFRILFRMQRTNDEMIRQIRDFQK